MAINPYGAPGPGVGPQAPNYQDTYPAMGLSGLAQGFTHGLELGHDWGQQADQLQLKKDEMSNEAGWREANLAALNGRAGQTANLLQQKIDKMQDKSDFAPAGQPMTITDEQGNPATALTDGKGGFKVVNPPKSSTGGVLAERQASANRFLDQLQDQLKTVNLPSESSGGWTGRPISWLDQIKAYANSNSPEGKLESLVNTGGPTIASGVSNRANEAEIARQLKEFGTEAYSRTPSANAALIQQMRDILTQPGAYKPGGAAPAGAPAIPAAKNAAAGWNGGNVHVYPDGTKAQFVNGQWVKA